MKPWAGTANWNVAEKVMNWCFWKTWIKTGIDLRRRGKNEMTLGGRRLGGSAANPASPCCATNP